MFWRAYRAIVQANQRSTIGREVQTVGLVIGHRVGVIASVKRLQRGAARTIDHDQLAGRINGVDVAIVGGDETLGSPHESLSAARVAPSDVAVVPIDAVHL